MMRISEVKGREATERVNLKWIPQVRNHELRRNWLAVGQNRHRFVDSSWMISSGFQHLFVGRTAAYNTA
eukprot:scaffold10533_cov108-Skeletonema_marinoi.AAC.2